jgi:hypothetical protein
MIGEVAARLSGGYMSGWTYPYASGVQPIRGAVQAALGRRPDELEARRSWTCAERAFISIPGRVRSIGGVEKARSAVRDLFLRVEPGKDAAFPENNVSKGGNVIACAPSREEAVSAAEGAARSILIRLEPGNPATDSFLAAFSPVPGGAVFPPDAFTPGPGILAALAAIPDSAPPLTESGGVAGAEHPQRGGARNEVRAGGEASQLRWLSPLITASEILFGAGLFPFPEFTSSGLKDYLGRSVEESLDAVRELCGLALPVGGGEPLLGWSFWSAFIRGGYQGAVYFLDNLREGV